MKWRTDQFDPNETQPRTLVVVGAAAGMGRWLSDHVLADLEWQRVVLVDSSEAILKLSDQHRFKTNPELSQLKPQLDPRDHIGTLSNACVVVCVPLSQVSDVVKWIDESIDESCLVIDTSHNRTRAAEAWGRVQTVGLHPLFGLTAPSAAGQTFVMCPMDGDPTGPAWLQAAVEGVGGTVNVMTNAHHDQVMSVVQNATHQALLSFADVVGSSGLDLENDLWANRTPVFELLTALAVRVLQPGQDATTASIQTADGAGDVSESLGTAHRRLSAARAGGESELAEYLASLREPFTGGLFAKIAQTGSLATSAVQSSRARIADHRRHGELIGVRTTGSTGSDKLQVGRVVATTPTSFTLENLLVGVPGRAALMLDATTTENAKRMGISGKTKRTEYRLGRVEVLSPTELESALDSWLATSARGCKVLIPESISGASAVHVVAGVTHVVGATLVTEEVRIGQRECVVRYEARIDRDFAALDRAIQQRVDETFVWPDGVVLPLTNPASRIGFLGPAGTFSDVAARQLARLVGDGSLQRVEYPAFDALVSAVINAEVDVAVLPITNSSSGLVDLAAGVLSAAPSTLTAGGVVDVPVRFDAYVAAGYEMAEGARVYSHPQGFRQCSQFTTSMRFELVECSSTAEACRLVAERKDGVALAATGMNADFGLLTARTSVGNLAGALTRFLVLGTTGTFGEPVRADALLRTVWLVEPDVAGRLPITTSPRYDEVLRGPSGRTLLVSTDPQRIPDGTVGARRVATIPWSPRTPLVVVE
jgi:prephenate dehydratase/prephenate dehydrogenase